MKTGNLPRVKDIGPSVRICTRFKFSPRRREAVSEGELVWGAERSNVLPGVE